MFNVFISGFDPETFRS